MQAITIAIGKVGIDYFARTVVADKVTATLNAIKPPDRKIKVEPFGLMKGFQSFSYRDVVIHLTDGGMVGYQMKYRGVDQGKSGSPAGNQFDLAFRADRFRETYSWREQYEEYASGMWAKWTSQEAKFDYLPVAEYMNVNPRLAFVYDAKTNRYALLVEPDTDQRKMVHVEISDPAIPKHSVIQDQDHGWFRSSHVSAATAKAIADMDFTTQINEIFPPIFASIPASGHLSEDIVYDFALAQGGEQNGLKFQDGEGITIGVTGAVSWNKEKYPEVELVTPVPRVPTAPQDRSQWGKAPFMNVYVSSYEISALYWAYFKAGKLSRIVGPEDLPSPRPLDVNTYIPSVEALAPYEDDSMEAHITPLKAPVVECRQAYVFSKKAMAVLKAKLTDESYQKVKSCGGKAYLSTQTLEEKLVNNKTPAKRISPGDFEIVLAATGQRALVTTSRLHFELVIQAEPRPNIVFGVDRVDVLTELKLGSAGGFRLTDGSFESLAKQGVPPDTLKKLEPMRNHDYASKALFDQELKNRLGTIPETLKKQIFDSARHPIQSLQFDCANVSSEAKFESSTVEDLEDDDGAALKGVWSQVGELQYMTAVKQMGARGVPIPIMSDFHFVFKDDDYLAVEGDYVSIATQVEYW